MSSSESDSDFDSFDADEEDVDLDSLFTAGKSKKYRSISIQMDNVIGGGGDKNKVFR